MKKHRTSHLLPGIFLALLTLVSIKSYVLASDSSAIEAKSTPPTAAGITTHNGAPDLLKEITTYQELCILQDLISNHINLPASNLRKFLFWTGIQFLTNLIWELTTTNQEIPPLWVDLIVQMTTTVKERQLWGTYRSHLPGWGFGSTGSMGWHVKEFYYRTASLFKAIRGNSTLIAHKDLANLVKTYLEQAEKQAKRLGLSQAKQPPLNTFAILAKIKNPASSSDQPENAANDSNDIFDVSGAAISHSNGILLPRAIASYDSMKYFQQMLYIIDCDHLKNAIPYPGASSSIMPFGSTAQLTIITIIKTLKARLAWARGSGTLTTNWDNKQLYYHFYVLEQALEASQFWDLMSLDEQEELSKAGRRAANKIDLEKNSTTLPILFTLENLIGNLRQDTQRRQEMFLNGIIFFKRTIPFLSSTLSTPERESIEGILNSAVDRIAWSNFQPLRWNKPELKTAVLDLLTQLKNSSIFTALSDDTKNLVDKYLKKE